MKLSTELFDLIKSLTKSEKRYFKLYASLQKGDKNYLKLFNEIESQEEYDEIAIKRKFAGEKFVKQLTFTKNYLYKLVMRSLQAYNAEKSVDARLSEIIRNCKIFYGKSLYREFFTNIKLGKKLSAKYERYNYHLQFIEMEKVVFFKKIFKYKNEASILKEEQVVRNKADILDKYFNLIIECVNYYRLHGRIRDKSLEEFTTKILDNPLMKMPVKTLSPRAREAYYRTHMFLADLQGDFEKMQEYCIKRLETVQANPEVFEDIVVNYWSEIYTYLPLINIRIGDFKAVNKYLKQADKAYKEGKMDEQNYFMVKYYIGLQNFTRQGQYSKAAKLVPEILEKIWGEGKKIDNNFKILIMFSMVKSLLLNDDIEGALELNNKLLNDENIKVRNDIKYYSELVSILIHYELGNYQLVKHLINSKLRFLSRQKQLYKMESILLNFIKKLPSFRNETEKLDRMVDIKRELDCLRLDKYEKNAFDYFPFDSWLENQIKKLS